MRKETRRRVEKSHFNFFIEFLYSKRHGNRFGGGTEPEGNQTPV
jgi:hypothetical protein